jgi:hypothetical protein
MLSRLGFDIDRLELDSQQSRQVRANRRLVRAKLRFLSMDDQIAIDGPKSGSVNLVDDLRQEAGAIESGPLWIGIGIMFPNIAQAGCPQQRISHGVANHVCVGMPHQPTRMGNPNTSKDERPSFTQPMRVVPDPNSHPRGSVSPHGRRMTRAELPSSQNRSVFLMPWLSRQLAAFVSGLCQRRASLSANLGKKTLKIWHIVTNIS